VGIEKLSGSIGKNGGKGQGNLSKFWMSLSKIWSEAASRAVEFEIKKLSRRFSPKREASRN
jgi:hypothetical protein